MRRATRADLPAIATTLGRAFHDDPVWRHTVRRHDDFERRVGTLCGIVAGIHLEDDDEVWITEDAKACAVWAPPGRWRIPPRRLLPHSFAALRAAGLRSVPNLAVLDRMEREHPDDPPHWYLAILGTDPDAQGRGLGSAVLRPVLDRCDDDVVHAYLESSKESNVAFYRRHGFEVVDRVEPGRGCPPIVTMLREPALR